MPDGVSNSIRRKIDNKNIVETVTYLIGQLGRNDSYNSDDLLGYELLSYAIEHIKFAQSIVGGRTVLIEYEENQNLINFYISNKFKLLPAYTVEEFILDDIIHIVPEEQIELRQAISDSIKEIAAARYEQIDSEYIKLIRII